MDINAEEIEKFLGEYKLIEPEEKDLNFFQIARFPRYENVSSNILSFFLKNNLILKLFLNCIKSAKPENIDKDLINKDFSNQKIDTAREKITKNNKRIDIEISTEDYIIGIENKIDAPLYNDMTEYESYLENEAKAKGKTHFLIILSNKPYDGYLYILHKDFSAELKKYYPELLNDLGHRYFLLLTEYVSNIDSFRGEHSMNKDFVRIARQEGNIDKIKQIIQGGYLLNKYLLSFAKKILNDLREYDESLYNKLFTYANLWDGKEDLYVVSYFQLNSLSIEQYDFTIDIVVEVSGFTIEIYERKKGLKKDPEKIKKILDEVSIFGEKYKIVDRQGSLRARYDRILSLEEYGELIKTLKHIFKYFEEYIKNN